MRLGIDMGGTKIETAVMDDGGVICARHRVPTPEHYDELISAVVGLVATMEAEVGTQVSVGIACPGAKCPHTGRMKNAQNVVIEGTAFDRDLERILRRPVRVANDAHCFVFSEAIDGAAGAASTVFGAIVGTGVGGGLVVDGLLLRGANGIVGEWGHNALPWPRGVEWPGPLCYCGRRGCIESYLSGAGMTRDHREVCGQLLSAAAIADRARRGDGECAATIERYAERMARAFAGVINLLDPDVIVLGGGLSKIDELYDLVPQMWSDYVVSKSIATQLVCNRFGDASGVRGAAWLWAAGEMERGPDSTGSPPSWPAYDCA